MCVTLVNQLNDNETREVVDSYLCTLGLHSG